MFKVPADLYAPSFDQTFMVGFGQWFKSSAADRREWRTRRDIANRLRAEQAKAARDARYQPQLADLRARAAEIRAEIAQQLAGRGDPGADLGLEADEERLRDGVVVTRPDSAHGLRDA